MGAGREGADDDVEDGGICEGVSAYIYIYKTNVRYSSFSSTTSLQCSMTMNGEYLCVQTHSHKMQSIKISATVRQSKLNLLLYTYTYTYIHRCWAIVFRRNCLIVCVHMNVIFAWPEEDRLFKV